MKKADMIERVKEWNIKISKEYEKKYECFKSLQDLAEEMGYPRYCSPFENFKNIINTPHVSSGTLQEANKLYSDYCFFEGEFAALTCFLEQTDNFNL